MFLGIRTNGWLRVLLKNSMRLVDLDLEKISLILGGKEDNASQSWHHYWVSRHGRRFGWCNGKGP